MKQNAKQVTSRAQDDPADTRRPEGIIVPLERPAALPIEPKKPSASLKRTRRCRQRKREGKAVIQVVVDWELPFNALTECGFLDSRDCSPGQSRHVGR